MRASALPAWHAWSMFRFRRRCGHEHFNTSVEPMRFLAFHPARNARISRLVWRRRSFYRKGFEPDRVRGRRSRNPRSVRSRIGEKRFTKQMRPELCKKCRKIQTSQPFSRRKLFALANILKLKNATKMHRHSGQAGDS